MSHHRTRIGSLSFNIYYRNTEDNDLIETLERQLDILKAGTLVDILRYCQAQIRYQHIDSGTMAAEALRSKVKKDPDLSRNSECQAGVQSELTQVNDEPIPMTKELIAVKSRLLSSKILAKETADVIIKLRNASGVEGKKSKEVGTKSLPGSEEVAESREDIDDSWTGFQSEGSNEKTHTDEQDEPTSDNTDEEEGEEDAGWESGTVISNDSDDDRPSSVKPTTSLNKNTRKVQLGSSKISETGAGESTFLPSLSVGFIDGHSGSDWSDAEANVADAPIKKNRRGQRARKAYVIFLTELEHEFLNTTICYIFHQFE